MLRVTFGAHFFDTSTSKSGPTPSVFNVFDLRYECASRHSACNFLTSQLPKMLRTDNPFLAQVLTCWLRRVLLRHKACILLGHLISKILLREWSALHVLTSKCASRHSRVHFFDISTAKNGPDLCFCFNFLTSKSASRQCLISHPARWLRTRRFSEPTFRPSEATKKLEKLCVFIFFLLTLSLLTHLSSVSFSSLTALTAVEV